MEWSGGGDLAGQRRVCSAGEKHWHGAIHEQIDAINTLNLAVFKDIPSGGARAPQFRAEAFYAFDYVQFSGPQLNPTNANFGRITSQTNAPRSIQFAVRFTW